MYYAYVAYLLLYTDERRGYSPPEGMIGGPRCWSSMVNLRHPSNINVT